MGDDFTPIINVERRTTPTLSFEFERKDVKAPFSLDGADSVLMYAKRDTSDPDDDAVLTKTLTVIPPAGDGKAMVKLTLDDTEEEGEFFVSVKGFFDGGATVVPLEKFILCVGPTALDG